MMRLEKIIAGLVMTAMLTSACGMRGEGNTVLVEEVPDKDTPVVAFAHKSVNPYVFLIMNEAMKKAVESRGWTYVSTIADYDPNRQNQQIVNLINQSPDIIVINPTDSALIGDVIALGNQEGIPMCTIDNHADEGDIMIEVSFDNYKAGVIAANAIIKELTAKYGEARGTVFNGYGAMTSQAWRLRKEGFESVMARHPKVDYMPVPTEGETLVARQALAGLLEEGIEIDAVHVPSEYYGRGVIEALKEGHRWHRRGEEGHIIFVSIDAEPYYVELVQEGYVDGAVAQDVIAYGFITAQLLNDYVFKDKAFLPGEYMSRTTYWKSYLIEVEDGKANAVIPPYLINHANADEKTHWSYKAEELWGYQFNR